MIYKTLKDFTQYEISDNGIIRKIVTKEIVKQRIHPREGLMMCDLYDNDLIARTVYPHKEVAKTFIPTKKKGRLLVIHINGKKKDNKVKNLQWITMGDFQKLQVKRGTRKHLGNPELYKHSKFWKAKNKKLKTKGKSTMVALTKNVKTTQKINIIAKQTPLSKQTSVIKVVVKPVLKKKKAAKASSSKTTQVRGNKPLVTSIKKTGKNKAASKKVNSKKPIVKAKKLIKSAISKVAQKKVTKPAIINIKKKEVSKPANVKSKVTKKVIPAKVEKSIVAVSKKPIAKVSSVKDISASPVSLKSKTANVEMVKLKTKPKRNRIRAKKVFSVKN
jgi:hypothetical protein